jgi:hypothetical protein
MILTIDEFNEFNEQYPELAQLVCLEEVELPIDWLEDN